MPEPAIPSATYRLQFRKEYTFRDAIEIVPYLRALGVSHVYASPFFQATPGSPHGYDVCDYTRLNAEIGSREDFAALGGALAEKGMKLIADFVPNHMGIGPANPWWMDVLENGPSSIHAAWFDIDWRPLKEELENKVLLPILGDQYGRVLERGEFRLAFSEGAFSLYYYETRLPLAPRTYRAILEHVLEKVSGGEAGSGDFVLELQSILTALDHLPERTDLQPEKIAERAREKEVIKRRLDRLCREDPKVTAAIEETLRQLQGVKGDPHSFDELDQIIRAQPYRLSFWRVAAEEINYRRFFDINNLAAIRMELPEVFDAAHALLFELIQAGLVHGVRIDHVDGLWNPREYLEKLQARHAEMNGAGGNPCSLYILVEKILSGDERLRSDWPVNGTTGYEFANQVAGVLIDRDAERPVTDTYQRFIGQSPRFADIAYRNKQLTMRLSLASEINVLGHMLNELSEQNRWYRDFTLGALTTAVREVIACFPVYRTYIEPGHEVSADDREVIRRAVVQARRRNPGIERSVFEFLREILLMQFPDNLDEAAREKHVRFVMKFQQCTGPITAKGLEDTAFYVYNRLVALNEVGGEPGRFGSTVEIFHRQNAARLADFPHAMLATSTHDTKRSEDVRARIAAISELPQVWRDSVRRWSRLNGKFRTEIEGESAPDANEEYLLYQTLLGTWPLTPEREGYVERIQDYMTKAIKEAKVNSSWIQPNEAWDEAVRKFIAGILSPGAAGRFIKGFEPVAGQIAQLGMINSLAQTLLKLTVPGVPDTYQGSEMWDFSLVDPDNRRPVDYQARRDALAALEHTTAPQLLENWRDGRIKLFVIRQILNFRRENPGLFREGSYEPLRVTGAFADSCIAFRRKYEGKSLVVVAPRLTARVGFPPIGGCWRDTMLEIQDGAGLRDLFTGRELPSSPQAPVAELLNDFPVAAFA